LTFVARKANGQDDGSQTQDDVSADLKNLPLASAEFGGWVS
jgi:hypothetical protein